MANKTIIDNSAIQNKTNANALRSSINFSSDVIQLTGSGASTKCTLSGLAQGVANDEAVTKQQLDNAIETLATGLKFGDPVVCATTENLDVTYSASAGTLTANANGAFSVDGITPAQDDRVLIKDQTNGVQNGVYRLTTAGDAGKAFVLERAPDADTPAECVGKAVLCLDGTANSSRIFAQSERIDDFVNDVQSYSRISGAIDTNRFDDGLLLSGNSVKINTGSTMTIVADQLQVANSGITQSQMASNAVGETQIIDGAVTTTKIAESAVTNEKIASQIDGAKLQNGTVDGSTKLTARSVPGSAIALRGIGTNELGQNVINADNCVANFINQDLVEGKSLDAAVVLADGSITELLHAGNSIPESAFKPLSISNSFIKNNAITAAKVLSGNITNDKLSKVSGGAGGAVTEDCIVDRAISNRVMATDACDNRTIVDAAVTNSKLADNSVDSRVINTLTSLQVAGEIQAGSIVLGTNSGGSGTTFALAKVIHNNINFTGNWNIPFGSWGQVGDNKVEFSFADKVTSVASIGSFEVTTNGLSSQIGILVAMRGYDSSGNKRPFLEPVVAEYKRTNFGVTHPQQMTIQGFAAATAASGDQAIAEIRVYARQMTAGGNAKVAANTEFIASHTVCNSTSGRQSEVYDGSSLTSA